MFLSAAQTRTLSKVMVTLAEPHGEPDIRKRLGIQLLELLGADYYASYVWDASRCIFGSRVSLNMSERNLSSYEVYYQHHDPITSQMQRHRDATLVEQVMPQSELVKTEFFNDFLYRDGLYWGVNMYAWHDDENIGDMRIWRSRKRERFGRETLDLLELIKPAFVAALRRVRNPAAAALPDRPDPVPLAAAATPARRTGAAPLHPTLTPRELAVVQLASLGLPDKAIAQRLGIGFTTVRTHIGNAFHKLGVDNRAQLAGRMTRL